MTGTVVICDLGKDAAGCGKILAIDDTAHTKICYIDIKIYQRFPSIHYFLLLYRAIFFSTIFYTINLNHFYFVIICCDVANK